MKLYYTTLMRSLIYKSRFIVTVILMLFVYSNVVKAKNKLTAIGTYDNVKSTSTGHCYGTSISMWQLENNNVIGLLDTHAGLCGVPPCSILTGSMKNDTVSFKTSAPVYDKLFSYIGRINDTDLNGQLNKKSVVLKRNSRRNFPLKDIGQFCSFWSKVPRCKGVKEYCQQANRM